MRHAIGLPLALGIALALAISPTAAHADQDLMPLAEAEAHTGVQAKDQGTVYVADEILVTLRPGTTVDELEDLMDSSVSLEDGPLAANALLTCSVTDGEIQDSGSLEPVVVLRVAAGATVAQAIAEIEGDPVVVRSSPNAYLECKSDAEELTGAAALRKELGASALAPQATTTNDPLTSTWAHTAVRLNDAWSLTRCDGSGGATVADKNVAVAVIDMGCAADHEDLKDRIIDQYDAYHVRNTVTDQSSNGHGTHVCGIVAGTANNGKGVAGATYNANLIPIKIARDNDTGSSNAEVLLALRYIIDNRAQKNIRVANMSAGGKAEADYDWSTDVYQRITLLRNEGVLMVTSAGNRITNTDPKEVVEVPYLHHPSDYDDTLSVINVTHEGTRYLRSETSNYNTPGVTKDSTNKTKDISAPGANIMSSCNGPWRTSSPKDELYEEKSGTSMAAPLVAGIAALCFAEDPTLTPSQVQTLLERTASTSKVGKTGWSSEYGYGLVDAYEAVSHIMGNVTVDAIPAQTQTGSALTPTITVRNASGQVLTQGRDYAASFRNNTNIGTATVTLTGIGDYVGTKTATFKIASKSSSDAGKTTPAVNPTNPTTITGRVMYRLYNPNSGEHFYTANRSERDSLTKVGWTYEGHAWKAPSSGTPVYRLYNPNAGDHHYTMSKSERDALTRAGWKYEGVGWYSGGTIPLWRQYNRNAQAGSHNYTASANERRNLVALGWRDEGIAWYGLS